MWFPNAARFLAVALILLVMAGGRPFSIVALAGRAEVNHDHGRARWQFGPNGAAPVVPGMDVAIFKQGRIYSLYAFLDKAPATS